MIVGTRKPLAELQQMLAGHSKILVAGCDTCVAESACGGRREVAELAAALQLAAQKEGRQVTLLETSVDRQCIQEFLVDVIAAAQEAEAVLSLACGAGVQALAARLETIPVYPALNTQFLGETAARGVWLENCRGCGDCQLGFTGGICPISRCAKRLLNGPCGGCSNGLCEINMAHAYDPPIPCAWEEICQRLAKLGRLEQLFEVKPSMDWSKAGSGGPRRVVRPDQQL
jgi:hypothetical protein